MSWRDCTTIAPVSAYHHRSYTERYSKFNQYHQDVILVAITSHVPEVLMSDEYLLNDAEQREAGLPKRSIVKVGKIVTLEQRLIRKQLGRMPEMGQQQLIHIAMTIFGAA